MPFRRDKNSRRTDRTPIQGCIGRAEAQAGAEALRSGSRAWLAVPGAEDLRLMPAACADENPHACGLLISPNGPADEEQPFPKEFSSAVPAEMAADGVL
jgi:hypothetical protein